MSDTLPNDVHEFMAWGWDQIKPHANRLVQAPLTEATLEDWLAGWSRLADLLYESFTRLQVRTTTHTNDEAGQARFAQYAEEVMPRFREWDQQMKEKLLASGLEPDGFSIPLRKMRVEAALFRAENLPLDTAIEKLGIEMSKITGARVIHWDGEELTFQQTIARLQDPDRAIRERAWRLMTECVQQDRAAMDDIWVRLLDLRLQKARNAGYENYRDFRWKELARFDYTPDDCKAFHTAIEAVVVPAASRLNARRQARMGLDTLRVWDNFWFLAPDPANRPPLQPYQTIDELNDKIEAIFRRVDPELGDYYHTMRAENLLDLESRKHKDGGGYMTEFPASRRPFIFTNAVGIHDNVQTLLHEGGHAFHAFEASHHPYHQQRMLEFMPMEFIEVGSMAMELLAAPYLAASEGGFYSEADAARARVEHLSGIIQFWPYMSVVDSFQHWIYENPQDARDTDRCDAVWFDLHRRYLPDLDWSGIEDTLRLYWRVQGHIAGAPFYYIEYGLAQLGAAQVWTRALTDQAGAVRDYRRALALGNTATLPDLYRAAGAKLAFDADTLRAIVDLIERTIAELDPA
ncbi:MAG: M3 family oligoendopeptidase [Anaerolineae bacterium]|nr:M3 family oligoendopeptidase [Anaerolineae bacterium]